MGDIRTELQDLNGIHCVRYSNTKKDNIGTDLGETGCDYTVFIWLSIRSNNGNTVPC